MRPENHDREKFAELNARWRRLAARKNMQWYIGFHGGSGANGRKVDDRVRRGR